MYASCLTDFLSFRGVLSKEIIKGKDGEKVVTENNGMGKSDKLSNRISLEEAKSTDINFFAQFLNFVAVFLRDHDSIKSYHLLRKNLIGFYTTSDYLC